MHFKSLHFHSFHFIHFICFEVYLQKLDLPWENLNSTARLISAAKPQIPLTVPRETVITDVSSRVSRFSRLCY